MVVCCVKDLIDITVVANIQCLVYYYAVWYWEMETGKRFWGVPVLVEHTSSSPCKTWWCHRRLRWLQRSVRSAATACNEISFLPMFHVQSSLCDKHKVLQKVTHVLGVLWLFQLQCVTSVYVKNVEWYSRWPTHCAVTPLVYSRSQGLPGRRCLHLERFAGGCDLRSITAGVQKTPEDSSVQPQLSEHMCYLNFVFLLWQWS